MSIPIIVIGRSGRGKTHSIKAFGPHEVMVINTDGKLLPFFNQKPDMLNVPAKAAELQKRNGGAKPLKVDIIRSWLNKYHDHRAVVVDDYGFALFEIYQRYRISEDEKLSNKYAAFDIVVDKLSRQVDALAEDGDVDRIVYFVLHEETDQHGNISPLVMGKMVNDKYVLEGHVTCTLQADKVGDQYGFHTNNGNPAKSPEGLFEDEFIPNDLRAVDARIREAYGYEPLKAAEGIDS